MAAAGHLLSDAQYIASRTVALLAVR